VLEANPTHNRATLFMKDVRASKDMLYDEEFAREGARRDALMDTPVTDFELSVRARNCLKKMAIRTLGDLLRISEAELLSYKNFGETSLVEIKSMLTAKGWQIRRIKIDGGCYEVYAMNERGERVEAYFHPRTFAPVPIGSKDFKG
jgi:DNA-directed RNA polymerase subunit alpha